MAGSDAGVTLEEVERAIGDRYWLLRFAPRLERLFEAEVGRARCKQIFVQNLIGLAVYDAFMLGDRFLVGDIFGLSVLIHLAVMTPLMVAMNVLIARKPPVWFRETLCATCIVVTTCAILALAVTSRSPLRDSEPFSVVLVILFATIVQRIRFWYMVVACLTSFVLYATTLALILPMSPERAGVADTVFLCVVVFSLIGCYTLEHEHRTGYLLGLRHRLRNDALETLSRYDALTEVGNRRALDGALEALDAGAATSRGLTAILLLDIDHFKIFNDENGHQAGDLCLKAIAHRVADLMGRDGSVFRFGGEEFLIIMTETSREQAMLVGQRLRLATRAAVPGRDGTDGFVTISVGIAVGALRQGLANKDLTTKDLVAQADKALYEAKSGGRDQVRLYDTIEALRPARKIAS